MKKIILILGLSMFFANSTFAGHKTLNAKNGLEKVQILCGETDSLAITMDNSWQYMNMITVSITGAKELQLKGFFWKLNQYSFRTNGDLTIDITKTNIFYFLIPFMVLCIISLLIPYLSGDGSDAAFFPGMIGLLSCVIPFIFMINSFHGGYLLFTPLAAFLTSWLIVFLFQKWYWQSNFRLGWLRLKNKLVNKIKRKPQAA